ncbi:MAG: ABC transporter permease [Anaerolineales bacterium]|nr:ABC transporter permease [Anaerolineales bacterium]MCS7248612.1 ABC transporter permease [Anaerolineales bacterium]MDW8162425.1 ABC transporter permease [Anaerolineales bacterium]MDW8446346.1 ABC transporter permease [Anaerolineales bacterium]
MQPLTETTLKPSSLTLEQVKQLERISRREELGRNWYKFSRNPISVVGLLVVLTVVLLAVFAPYIAPYPAHAGPFTDFANAKKPPSPTYWLGTDQIGRDILSRILFGMRSSLLMGVVVLSLVVPPGVLLGLLAGYYHNTWIDTLIMRVTDIFLAVPPLILALAVASVLEPNLWNSMMAVSLMWWPWYTRLVYGLATALRNEYFVIAAEVTGASTAHILFREIFPNTVSPILTKMSLDIAWVIIIGSMLSFVGLGVQPPEPSLGTMIADGAKYLPDQWWIAVFPALAIVVIVLGFNLLGDGIRDMFASEEA